MGSKCSYRHTRYHLWAPNAVTVIPYFIYGLQMQLQTYHILIKGSKCADIAYFIYGLQMQLQTYQISFMGSKCSYSRTIFHLWTPNAVTNIPDIIYGLQLQTYHILMKGSKCADIAYFIYGLQMQLKDYQISFMGSKCS